MNAVTRKLIPVLLIAGAMGASFPARAEEGDLIFRYLCDDCPQWEVTDRLV